MPRVGGREKPKYSNTYDSSKVVAIGNEPPWFVYLMTHNERSSNFKCYTFIGIASNPFRKHMMHKLKALPHCKKTRPASSHWVLAEAVGPFEAYVHAKRVKDIWMDITRGENGRHMKGMKIVSMINGYNDDQYDEEEESDERLLELKNLAHKMNFKYIVRCFSRIVQEDIPYSLLRKLPPHMCKPSESNPLTLYQVLDYVQQTTPSISATMKSEDQDKISDAHATDPMDPMDPMDPKEKERNILLGSPFDTPRDPARKRKRVEGPLHARKTPKGKTTMASPFDDNPFNSRDPSGPNGSNGIHGPVYPRRKPMGRARPIARRSSPINVRRRVGPATGPKNRALLISVARNQAAPFRSREGRVQHPSPFEDSVY
jgi:hypothetical protein